MSSVLEFAEWTREQKEEYAKQRMLEMQLKNAKIKQRHAEVEQDRIQAEHHNSAVTSSSKVISKTEKVCEEQDSAKKEKKIEYTREWDWGKPDLQHWESPEYHMSYKDYRSSHYDRYSDRRDNYSRNERSDRYGRDSHHEKRYSFRNDSRHEKTYHRRNNSQSKIIDNRRSDSYHEKTDSHRNDSHYENTDHNRSEQKSGSRKVRGSQNHKKHDSDENNKICSTNLSCNPKRSKEVENKSKENSENSQNYPDKRSEKHDFKISTTEKGMHSLPFISDPTNLDNKKSMSNVNAPIVVNLWKNNIFNEELDMEYRVESWVDNVNKSKKWVKERSPFQLKNKLPDKPYFKLDGFEHNLSYSSSDSESLKDFNITSKEISAASCSYIPSKRQFNNNMPGNQQENAVEHVAEHHQGRKININNIPNLANRNNNENLKNQERYNDQRFNKFQLQHKQKSYDTSSNRRLCNDDSYSKDININKDITCTRDNEDEWEDYEQTHETFDKTAVLPTKTKQHVRQSCSMQKIEKHSNDDKYGKVLKEERKDDGIWEDYKQTSCSKWVDCEQSVQTWRKKEKSYIQKTTENEKQTNDRIQNNVKHSSKDDKYRKQEESDNEGVWGDYNQTSYSEWVDYKQAPKTWNKKEHSSMQRENIKQSCHNFQKSAKHDYNDKYRKLKQFDSEDTWGDYKQTSQSWGKLPQSSGQKVKEYIKPTSSRMQKNKNHCDDESKYNNDDGMWGNIDQSDILWNLNTNAKDHKDQIKGNSESKNRNTQLANENKEHFKDEQKNKTLQECQKHNIEKDKVSDDGGWCTLSEESDQDTKKNKIRSNVHDKNVLCSLELANQEQKAVCNETVVTFNPEPADQEERASSNECVKIISDLKSANEEEDKRICKG